MGVPENSYGHPVSRGPFTQSGSNFSPFSNNFQSDSDIFKQVRVPEKQTSKGRLPPVLDNSFMPPTTYRKQPEAEPTKDPLYQVANHGVDKRNVISSYVPQNNFVDPTGWRFWWPQYWFFLK